MAADRVIDETGVGEYTPNGVSRLLAGPAYQGMVCDRYVSTLINTITNMFELADSVNASPQF